MQPNGSTDSSGLAYLAAKVVAEVELCVRYRVAVEKHRAPGMAQIDAEVKSRKVVTERRRYRITLKVGRYSPLDMRRGDIQVETDFRKRIASAKRTVTRRAKKAALRELWLTEPPQPPRIQLAASAGSGKTSAFLSAIAGNAFLLSNAHIHAYAPTHALCAEHASKIPGAQVMQGRNRLDTDGLPLCRRNRAADALAKAGLGIFENLCRQPKSPKCRHFDECQWIAQWEAAKKAGVKCFAHSWIPLGKPFGMARPDFVIIDESCWQGLIQRFDIAPEELRRQGAVIGVELAEAVLSALMVVGGELAALRRAGITSEALTDAAKLLDEAGQSSKIQPNESDLAIERKINSYDRKQTRRTAKLFRLLAREVELTRPGSHGVWFNPEKRVRVDGRTEAQPRLEVTWTKRPNVPKEAGLVLLDADADEVINERLFGQLEVARIPLPRRAHIVQVTSTSLSKRRLIGSGKDSVRQMEAVLRLIRAEVAGGKRVLIVTYLSVRRMLTGEDEGERLPPAGQCEGADVAHFGAIRGLDCWKNHDTVIILGRNQPPLEPIEALARALWSDDPEPLTFAEEGWTETNVLLGGLTVGVSTHPDRRTDRLLRQVRECESLQAIDRLRLIHAQGPKRVVVACDLPLSGLTPDEFTSWPNLTRPATRAEQCYVGKGIMPLSPRDMARVAPDLWPTEKAAEKDLERNRPGIDAPWLHDHGAAVVSYRVKGQRGPKDSRAFVDTLQHPEPLAALVAVLGTTLAKCDVVRVGGLRGPAAMAPI